ncbi:NOG1 family protein [Methanimicrococcus blatticola]|uniref:Nucleolar GTP-binding protein n=1 Tax=Methanimicrococcus blatticola TaxID=91560 RepID=A0A484F3D9_9EURY|nr:NOG1 family protein [Methanimicrococcus blatticola]MBZ3935910.1 NOG1 family protein [Methanimicrococcus blatticola]MCC2509477.1 NOG1 family protein [Methanimicrococcus blatticola]TDQ68354.1 nucleolar GTP-binding protein [Methanimicrococcus blatticola]
MIFEKIKTIPTSEELLDKAYSRSVRTMAGKTIDGPTSRCEANEAMLLTAANILTDNLASITKMFPSFDNISPFYYDLADILIGVDDLKKSLNNVKWASEKIHSMSREYIGKIRGNKTPDVPRKEAFGRMSSIIGSISKDLLLLGEARNVLRKLPDVREEPTVIVAGYPNVGKSSFVKSVTNATPEVASYPFTTKGIHIGHMEREGLRYQIIDTPGLLDRPMSERNEIELQAITALRRLDAIVLILIDPSESCGYDIEAQLKLAHEIQDQFVIPSIIVANKADRDEFKKPDEIEYIISTMTGEGIENLVEKLIGMLPKVEPKFEEMPPLRDDF